MGNDIIHVSICARTDTVKFKEGDFSHMLSLLDPQVGAQGVVIPDRTQHLGRLIFNDLDDIEVRDPKYYSYIPPRKSDVIQIMEFFRHMRENQGSGVLIHCEAGISRSCAAAIVGLCGIGLPPESAFDYIIGLNEMGLPNRRMLRMADEILGSGGKLTALARHQRQELFKRFAQPDPLLLLEQKLDKMGRTALAMEFMKQRFRAAIRTLRMLTKSKQRRGTKPTRFIRVVTEELREHSNQQAA
jgi:predicted protein tyrosine phosphatase